MEEMLTARQVAEVKGCSYKYIQKILKDGKLKAVETLNDKNRKTYLIPLTELDEELQKKWSCMSQNQITDIECEERTYEKKIDLFSYEERKEIDFWTVTVNRWMEYRNKAGVTSKAEVDRRYVELLKLENPNMNLSVDTLYRKWKAIREKDTDGLIDKRGKWKKGKSSVDEVIWQAFLYYYLDESKHSIQKCIEYTQLWAQEKRPELFTDIPSYYSFYRKINNDLMVYLKIFGREGEKALSDRCEPYIRRFYDDIASNEWWIADNHTFDVFVKVNAGATLHLIKAKAGSGRSDTPYDLTDVVEEKQLIQISNTTFEDAKTIIQCVLSNLDVESGYTLKQIGIFALDELTNEEILFIIGQDDIGDPIPSISQNEVENVYNIAIQTSNAPNVIIDFNRNDFIRRKDFEGALNTAIVDFTEETRRENIAAGDSMKVILGKIKKFFTDLKTVAFSGNYSDLTNKPTIPSGSAASQSVANNLLILLTVI